MAYIDKDKVKELIVNYGKGAISDGQKTLDPVDDIVLIVRGVDLIPVADVVEVKHGHWIINERNIPKMKEFHKKGIALHMSEKSIFWACSCCGEWGSPHDKYCRVCGAIMDVPDTNDGKKGEKRDA